MSDGEGGGGGGWIKWLIGILVTLAVGVFVPIYLANRSPSTGPAAQTLPATTTARPGPTVVLPSLRIPVDLTKPAHLYTNKTSGAVGSVVSLSGDGFKPGEEITLMAVAIEVGRTTANESGGFVSVNVTVPSFFKGFQAGTPIEFDATGSESLKHADAPFTLSG